MTGITKTLLKRVVPIAFIFALLIYLQSSTNFVCLFRSRAPGHIPKLVISKPSELADPQNLSPIEGQVCPRWITIGDAINDCITDELAKLVDSMAYWTSAGDAIMKCTTNLRVLLGLQLIANEDDTKGYIPFVDKADAQKSCVSLTLGIGNDTQAEEGLQRLLPPCTFIGADPMEPAGLSFTKLGKYYPVAVTNETGNSSAMALLNVATKHYGWKTVETIEFMKFLKTALPPNVSIIDFLLFDAEGAEYKLMEYFYRGGKLEKEGITVCQLSLEIHGASQSFGLTTDQWRAKVDGLFKFSDFLPIWGQRFWHHYRLFLINRRNPDCFWRFFRTHCGQ